MGTDREVGFFAPYVLADTFGTPRILGRLGPHSRPWKVRV